MSAADPRVRVAETREEPGAGIGGEQDASPLLLSPKMVAPPSARGSRRRTPAEPRGIKSVR
ncbi:hypothetical protein C472_11399 [Halorubrum tebenquichense DSM 14210]|uniref:Uncharacterized protein n=1 Tax=Halorubrum tebenquichense DSM 14210 TaxID=1227485 RepID=M0DNB0_9EURY|nr:hypothetical protein C472_11399 [Halorubrum tebenquichense DSM 14210]